MFNFPVTTQHCYFSAVDASFDVMLLTPSCEAILNTKQMNQQLFYLSYTNDIISLEYNRA